MKLVDILARELKEWPEGIVELSQQQSGYLFDEANYPTDIHVSVAGDWFGAIVTRTQWQEAREALSKAADSVSWDWVWAKAPKKATHFMPAQSENNRPVFWRVENGVARHCWAMDSDLGNVRDEFKYSASGAPSYKPDLCVVRPQNEGKPWNGEGLPPVGTVCEHAVGSAWHPVFVIAQDEVHGEKRAVFRFCIGEQYSYFGATSKDFRQIRTPEQIAAEEREKAVEDMLALDPYDPKLQLGMMSRKDFCATLYDAGYRKVNDGNQKA